jgi:hypothetical protein
LSKCNRYEMLKTKIFDRYEYTDEIEPWKFDQLVKYLVNATSGNDSLKYGIPVDSSEPLPGSEVLEGLATIVKLTGPEGDEIASLKSIREHSRRRQPDKSLIMQTMILLTGYDDPRTAEAVRSLAPLAFAGLLNNWDIYDEKDNLNLPFRSEPTAPRGDNG